MQDPQIGYTAPIESLTLQNQNYRQVLYTGLMQLVLMSLNPGEEIGEEAHEGHGQFFRIEQGRALATLGDQQHELVDGDVLIVPSGVVHNVANIGDDQLKLYTIYTPAEHPAGTIQQSKQ